MSDTEIQIDQPENAPETVTYPQAPPIESRFLFVDVAALRAKQLRRGAKPRLAAPEPETTSTAQATPTPAPGTPGGRKVKAERVAMQEVRQHLVEWNLPDFKAVFDIR
jgi:hypothetical protein